MAEKDLNISLATNMLTKLDFYLCFSQKWAHIEKTDETKDVSFLIKDDELLEKYKFGKNLKLVS